MNNSGVDIDYSGHPKCSFDSLLQKYTGVYLCLDDILKSKEAYVERYQDILDILKYGFENPEIRKKEISFIIHRGDKTKYTLQLRHFLSNMIFWYALMDADCYDRMDASYIFDFKGASLNDDINFMNTKLLPAMEDEDFHTQSRIIDEITHHMTAISKAFNPLFGLGISVYSIYQADRRNPRIGQLMHEKLDPTMQPIEIESELSARTEELIDLFIKDGVNDLAPMFLSGKNLSKDQFKEIAVMIGLKSDINGNTIPHLIDRNILVDGLNVASAYYLDGVSGRKSLIMSKTKMGEPGAFSKKAINSAAGVHLRQDYDNCHSIKPIWYTVKNADFLKMLDKRYYYDNNGELRLLNYQKDTHLIGHRIPFKSPCTCASKDGVCAYCYGGLYDLNKDLFSAGAYAAMKITEPMGQKILSAKHDQTTESNLIEFPPEFNDQFELYSNDVSVRQDVDSDSELFIRIPEIFKEETEDTVDYFCTSFDVMSEAGMVLYHIGEKNGAKLYLSAQLHDLCRRAKDSYIPISLESFDDDSSVLFNIEIKNRELSKPIKNINRLLNTNAHMGCDNLDDLCQTMAEQQLDAGIMYNFVHFEMLLRSLIRKKSNIYEYPNFGPNGDLEDYTVLRLNDALFKNASPVIGLSYGYLRKQILSPEFYEKTAPSHFDPMFVERLSDVI